MENKFEHLWEALEQSEKQLPNTSFLKDVEKLIGDEMRASKLISMKSLLGIAASFLILIFANFYIINVTSSTVNSDFNTSLQDDYSLIPNPLI